MGYKNYRNYITYFWARKMEFTKLTDQLMTIENFKLELYLTGYLPLRVARSASFGARPAWSTRSYQGRHLFTALRFGSGIPYWE